MSNSTRTDILSALSELSRLCPNFRFGQLVVNLAYMARGHENAAIWDVEDDELLAAAREFLANRRAVDNGAPLPSIDLPVSPTDLPLADPSH